MFGYLNSFMKLAENMAALTMAPVEIAVDLTNAVLEPFVETVEEIKADIKACTD